MSRPVLVPGARDVRGRLDEATDPGSSSGDADSISEDADSTPDDAGRRGGDPSAVVVACPPHPQHGGSRADQRLRAVADALGERGADCLRIDYGPWDEGIGEHDDARAAVAWAVDRYDAVGLFGYSFGASVALLAAADDSGDPGPRPDVDALSALAPTARLGPDLDAVGALDRIECPVQLLVGERDDTVDWEPVAERAAALGHDVERLPADHFFVDRHPRIGDLAAAFLASRLRERA